MSFFDRLLGRRRAIEVRDGMCVFRRREIAEYIKRPEQPNFAEETQTCDNCKRPMPELLLTTGGPHGDPEVWLELPIAIDGWGCFECGVFRAPRKMKPEEIHGFLGNGVREGEAGRLVESEWWFTRAAWDWPGYAPAHVDLAEATRRRMNDLEEPLKRKLRTRARDEYERAVASYERSPEPGFVRAVVRAHLILAEMAIEDRAFDRAGRSIDAVLALALAEDLERAKYLRKYVDERQDLFDAAAALVNPYMNLMDRRAQSIESPQERSKIVQALEDLERHYALSHNWRALWVMAMGRAALDGNQAALDTWRRAWSAHPGERDIAREFSLALLRTENIAEALVVNRAITAAVPGDSTLWCNRAVCELLAGELAEARRCIDRAREIDAADPIAKAVEARIVKSEGGAATPKSLGEMERGQ